MACCRILDTLRSRLARPPGGVLALALALATSLGCSAFRGSLTCPARGGPAWTELASRHFVLQTDLAAKDARVTLGEFEALYAALGSIMPRRAEEPGDPIEIALFDRPQDFREMDGAKDADAFFNPFPAGELEPRPVLIMHGGLEAEKRVTFLHELAHRFVHQRFAAPPPWLDEGLAQYYSTLEVDGRRVLVGGRLAMFDFSDQPRWWTAWNDTFFQRQIPASEAPSLAALVTADRRAFYVAMRGGSPSVDESHHQAALYAGAWKLVQLWMNGPNEEDRARFQRYLAALERGARPSAAFAGCFDAAELPRLEAAYRATLTDGRLKRTVFALSPSLPSLPAAERSMSDADVHVLWARLRPWTAGHMAAVRADLEEALAREPGSAEARFRRAIFFLHEGQPDDAERDFDAALAARPAEPAYLAGRLLAYQARASGREATAAERERELVDRLARVATSSRELNVIADYHASARDPGRGLPFSERAIRADPLCWTCQQTYAVLLYELGREADADAANARALALVPEGVRAEKLLVFHSRLAKARAPVDR